MIRRPSSAASVGVDASAGYLRTHLAYELSNVRSVVGFRTCCLLRGIRGVDGTRWAAQVLQGPPFCDLLADTRAACATPILQQVVRGLHTAHEQEEQRRIFEGEAAVSAARFSQHHEGRHAGQSGKFWLDEVESASSAIQMAFCLALVQTLLPQLWLGDRAPRVAKPMQDADLMTLVTLFAQRWPFVSTRSPATAGDYTAMDFGRLFCIAAVADGVVEPQSLSRVAFVAVEALQGRSVQRFHRDVDFGYVQYAKLHAKLVKDARTHCAPPEWAVEASTRPLWPGVFVLCCEYSQCVNKFGYARLRSAALAAKNSGVDVGAVVADYVQFGGEGGQCLTACLIEKVLAASAGTKASAASARASDSRKDKKENKTSVDVDKHIDTAAMLASHGFIPKLFWWTTPDVLSILEGAREGAEAAGKNADAAFELAIQIHGRLATPSAVRRSGIARHAQTCVKG